MEDAGDLRCKSRASPRDRSKGSYMHVCSYYANTNAVAVPRSMCLDDIQISGRIKVSIMKGRRWIGRRGSSHQVRVTPRGQATGRSVWTDRGSIIRKWPAGKRRPPAGASVLFMGPPDSGSPGSPDLTAARGAGSIR